MRRLAIGLIAAFAMAMPAAAQTPDARLQQAQYAPYDVSQLNPTVREIVLMARQREQEAHQAAALAREAAQRSADAAARARRGDRGYYVDSQSGQRYEGGWSNGAEGYGITNFFGGVFDGDSYHGQHSNNQYGGYGVYNWAVNENNAPGQLRFEGQFYNDQANGVGVRIYRDGQTRAGEVANWRTNGFGVLRATNGWRYEGQFSGGAYQGYGVLWDPQGRVSSSGLWQNGELVRAM